MKKIIAISLCVAMLISTMMVSAFAEDPELMSDVYVSATAEEERAAGTVSDPTNSIVRAMYAVKDGGTIHIDGAIVIPEGFSFNKNVTIVGDDKATDIIDFSARSTVNLGADTCFDHVTLIKTSGTFYLAANGHTLVVGENCATSGDIGIYGGGYQAGVAGDTNVTLLSGEYISVYGGGHLAAVSGSTYLTIGGTADVHNDDDDNVKYNIYGGGYGGEVGGNTNVWVGGNANGGSTPADHDKNLYYIFGGGYNGYVRGSTTVVFTGNAKSSYVYGGMHGPDQNIDGGTNVYFTGGYAMCIYGGSAIINQNCDANVVMTGGEVEQVMGGCNSGNLVGNVNVKLIGGTVTRRVFGGCYNDYGLSGWNTNSYVNGTVTLTIGEKSETFDLALNSDSDRALSAHSRRSSVAGEETGNIVFVSEQAQSDYQGKLSTGSIAGGTAYNSKSVDTDAVKMGDVNLDGEVDQNDILAIYRHVYDPSVYALWATTLADMDGDGKVTNADLLILVQG